MQKRITLLFVSIFLLSFILFYVANTFNEKRNIHLSGNIIQNDHWNNYNLKAKLFSNNKLIEQTTSALNGYFEFKVKNPGSYLVYFFKDQHYLSHKTVTIKKDQPAKITARYTDRHYRPLYFTEVFGLISAIILLILGIIAFKKVNNLSLALSFFLIITSFIFINGTEFLQIVLANFGREILAGSIFPLKQVGLILFGPAFFVFFHLFPRSSPLIKNKKILTLLAIIYLVEIPILLSWSAFGSDIAFNAFWHFSYDHLRILFISQVTIFTGFSIWRLLDLRKKEEDIQIKNKLNIITFNIFAFFILVTCLVFIPLIFFQGKEFFSGQYNLTASISTLVIGIMLFYSLTKYQIISSDNLIKNSLTYSMLLFFITIFYSLALVYINNILRYLDNHLINVYLLIFFVVLSFYLKDKLQKILDKLFYGDQKKQKEALLNISNKLLTTLDQQNIINLIEKNIKNIFKVKNAAVILDNKIKTTSRNYFLKNSPQVKLIQQNTPFPVAIMIPLKTNKLLGLLLLGDKTSGGQLTSYEIELLLGITAQAAIALNNALLHQASLATQAKLARSNQLASLGTLSAGVAHEIKNPLAAINTLVKLLPQRHAHKSFRDQFMEIVPRQLDRINSLVISMLNYAKPKAYKFSRFSLNDLLDSCLQLVMIPAKKSNISIIKNFQSLKDIQGSSKELEQAFINILLNAIQAMPAGGKLAISTKEERSKRVVIISDTGSGIPKDKLSGIFDPFYSTKPQGTGLGLSITFKILERHKARIEVSSVIKKGTTFKISFS